MNNKMEDFLMKKLLFAAAGLFASVSLFAYNPPAGGQNVLRLSSPFLLGGSASAAGGALYEVIPSSIVNNPALPAFEQRIVLDVGATMFNDSNDIDGKTGSSFDAGLLIPGRYGVATFLAQGVFAPLIDMHLGKSVNFTGNVSKDITDYVSVGMNLNLGIFWGYESDWTASASFGAFWNYGDLAFMKNVRFGAALMNLGKMYSQTEVLGISGDDYADMWPGLATPKVGMGATLFESGKFEIGASVDLSSPAFQDFVLNAGCNIQYAKFLKLSTGWEYDVREYAEGSRNVMPSVVLSFKFNFSSKDGSMLANKGWQESEMTVAAGWQQLYEDVNAYSAGAVLKLGMPDNEAPKITLWGEE